MSFVFPPMTEEELTAINLVDEDVYNFRVEKSTRKVSKQGNPMCEIAISIWNEKLPNHKGLIFDYLVFSNVPLNIKKIKRFCDTAGLHEEYKRGELPEDLTGLQGKAAIGIQDPMPKPNGGYYDRKNVVVEYVVTDKGAVKSELGGKPGTPEFNDDIPF